MNEEYQDRLKTLIHKVKTVESDIPEVAMTINIHEGPKLAGAYVKLAKLRLITYSIETLCMSLCMVIESRLDATAAQAMRESVNTVIYALQNWGLERITEKTEGVNNEEMTRLSVYFNNMNSKLINAALELREIQDNLKKDI